MHIYINIHVYIIFFSKSSWIAANDIKIEMDFQWGQYGQSIEYGDFRSLDNHYNREDCVLFHTAHWYDVPCWGYRHIMCEKRSSKLPSIFDKEMHTLRLSTNIKVISHPTEVT